MHVTNIHLLDKKVSSHYNEHISMCTIHGNTADQIW